MSRKKIEFPLEVLRDDDGTIQETNEITLYTEDYSVNMENDKSLRENWGGVGDVTQLETDTKELVGAINETNKNAWNKNELEFKPTGDDNIEQINRIKDGRRTPINPITVSKAVLHGGNTVNNILKRHNALLDESSISLKSDVTYGLGSWTSYRTTYFTKFDGLWGGIKKEPYEIIRLTTSFGTSSKKGDIYYTKAVFKDLKISDEPLNVDFWTTGYEDTNALDSISVQINNDYECSSKGYGRASKSHISCLTQFKGANGGIRNYVRFRNGLNSQIALEGFIIINLSSLAREFGFEVVNSAGLLTLMDNLTYSMKTRDYTASTYSAIFGLANALHESASNIIETREMIALRGVTR